MYSIAVTLHVVHIFSLCFAKLSDRSSCKSECLPEETQCAFDMKNNRYKMFSSRCAMAAHSKCHGVDLIQTPLKYCVKSLRRFYTESCPVFCPSHYSPVCGASKHRSYAYRTFTNGCYLDMINCRGDEDFSTYYEVPLKFCQNHLMKNIFAEQVVVSNLHDYDDYE